MVQFIQFPVSCFSQTSFTKDLHVQCLTMNNEPGRKQNNIHVELAMQLNTYRTMINLYDTLCTNSKVSVTLATL